MQLTHWVTLNWGRLPDHEKGHKRLYSTWFINAVVNPKTCKHTLMCKMGGVAPSVSLRGSCGWRCPLYWLWRSLSFSWSLHRTALITHRSWRFSFFSTAVSICRWVHNHHQQMKLEGHDEDGSDTQYKPRCQTPPDKPWHMTLKGTGTPWEGARIQLTSYRKDNK